MDLASNLIANPPLPEDDDVIYLDRDFGSLEAVDPTRPKSVSVIRKCK